MMKLQVIQKKILRSIYDGDRHASTTSIHRALSVRSFNEAIKRTSAKLYQRIRQYDNPIIAALGNYDIHRHCSYKRPKQILREQFTHASNQ
jgi:hypothetical protein